MAEGVQEQEQQQEGPTSSINNSSSHINDATITTTTTVAIVIRSRSLKEWHALPPTDRPRLVDVRAETAFETRRLTPSINLPFGNLLNLLFELPEPSLSLAVVATTAEEGERAVALLKTRDWHHVSFIFVGGSGEKEGEEEEGKESGEEHELWTTAAALGMMTSGRVMPRNRHILYTPNPFLASYIDYIEESLTASPSFPSSASAADGTNGGGLTCCDVGCGAGRDGVWLAKRGKGWRVRCMDRLPRCLDRVQRLAARHGVTDLVECEASVVRGARVVSSSASPSFETKQYDLVLAIRFLERDFLPALGAMVRSGGGFLLFVSFVAREDGVPYEHPKDPRKVLEHGELARVFGKEGMGFETVEDRLEVLPDGRVLSAFLARRL